MKVVCVLCLLLSTMALRHNQHLFPLQSHKTNDGSLENYLLYDGGLLQIRNSSLSELQDHLAQKREVFCNILIKAYYDQCSRLFDCGLCSASMNCGWCETQRKCLPVSQDNKEHPACKRACPTQWVSKTEQCNALLEISADPDIVNYKVSLRRRRR